MENTTKIILCDKCEGTGINIINKYNKDWTPCGCTYNGDSKGCHICKGAGRVNEYIKTKIKCTICDGEGRLIENTTYEKIKKETFNL